MHHFATIIISIKSLKNYNNNNLTHIRFFAVFHNPDIMFSNIPILLDLSKSFCFLTYLVPIPLDLSLGLMIQMLRFLTYLFPFLTYLVPIPLDLSLGLMIQMLRFLTYLFPFLTYLVPIPLDLSLGLMI